MSTSDLTETPASATRAKISVTSPNASDVFLAKASASPRVAASLTSSGSPATVRSASSAALRRHGAISRSRLDANEQRNSVRSAANGSTNASETKTSAEEKSVSVPVSVSFPRNSTDIFSSGVRASSSSSVSSSSSASRGGDRNAKNDDLELEDAALPAEAEVEVGKAEEEAEALDRSTTFVSSRRLGLAKRRNATAHFVAARPSATASPQSPRRRIDLELSPGDTTVASENVFVTSAAHRFVLIASRISRSSPFTLSKA